MHWRNIGNQANMRKLSKLWFLKMEHGGRITNAISMTQHQNCTQSNNQWLDIPVLYTTSQKSRHNVGLQPIFLTEKQQNICWQRKNLRCMILDYHIFIWAKIRCCRVCTKLQPSIGHHWFLPSHCKAKQNLVLISLNSYPFWSLISIQPEAVKHESFRLNSQM